jgi:hypothetical protein
VLPFPFSQTVDGVGANCLNRKRWAHNSAVECHPHTVEVVGSNPTAPTIPTNFSRKFSCLVGDALLRVPESNLAVIGWEWQIFSYELLRWAGSYSPSLGAGISIDLLT